MHNFVFFFSFQTSLHKWKQVLTIAALSKGQQQQQKPLQQQINELLTTTSHKSKPQPIVEIEKQQIQQKEPIPSAGEQTYRPITFPTSDEDLTDRFQAPLVNNNLVTPNVEAKVTTPQQELTRPTRRVMAATVANVENRYTDDQLDYVRDFAWKMFQVGLVFVDVFRSILLWFSIFL